MSWWKTYLMPCFYELVVAAQGCLKLQIHAGHNGIEAFFVHLGKRKTTRLQEQVTCMFGIVEVVGIVDNAFDVALVVANLHTGFKTVFAHSFRYFVISIFRSFSNIHIQCGSAGSPSCRNTPSSTELGPVSRLPFSRRDRMPATCG